MGKWEDVGVGESGEAYRKMAQMNGTGGSINYNTVTKLTTVYKYISAQLLNIHNKYYVRNVHKILLFLFDVLLISPFLNTMYLNRNTAIILCKGSISLSYCIMYVEIHKGRHICPLL